MNKFKQTCSFKSTVVQLRFWHFLTKCQNRVKLLSQQYCSQCAINAKYFAILLDQLCLDILGRCLVYRLSWNWAFFMFKSHDVSPCEQWGVASGIYCWSWNDIWLLYCLHEAKTKRVFPITSAETFVYLHCYCLVCNTLDRVIYQATDNINVSIPRDGKCCSTESAIKMRNGPFVHALTSEVSIRMAYLCWVGVSFVIQSDSRLVM